MAASCSLWHWKDYGVQQVEITTDSNKAKGRLKWWADILKTISGKMLAIKPVACLNSCSAKIIAGKSKICICCQLQHCIELREPKVYCDGNVR